jgi:hypothetical protein
MIDWGFSPLLRPWMKESFSAEVTVVVLSPLEETDT